MSKLPKALLPLAFASVMISAAVNGAAGWALVPAGPAAAAVGVAIWWRPAATIAVVTTVLTVLLAATPPLAVALSGLAATCYLVTRHRAATVPTMTAAVGFAVTAALAAALLIAVPVELPWIPLAAPLVLLVAYLMAVRPFVAPDRASSRM
ncbi:hypothetical protein GR927_14335 [Mycolicibacterium sp. 3033]|nr:hypothetical protein [Mycolicibacterium aurantiacum]